MVFDNERIQNKKLQSTERNPFTAKNQTLRSYQSMCSAYGKCISRSYPNRSNFFLISKSVDWKARNM